MKFILLKRKALSLLLCFICAVAMFYIVNHPAVIGAAATTRQLPIYCVQRDQKMVSLSFDAAWGDVRVRQKNLPNLRRRCVTCVYPLCPSFGFSNRGRSSSEKI